MTANNATTSGKSAEHTTTVRPTPGRLGGVRDRIAVPLYIATAAAPLALMLWLALSEGSAWVERLGTAGRVPSGPGALSIALAGLVALAAILWGVGELVHATSRPVGNGSERTGRTM